MKKNCLLPALLVLSLVLSNCRTAKSPVGNVPNAKIMSEGFLTCFEPSMADAKIWCEASAVLAQKGHIYLANDKDMLPPRSSVFFVNGGANQLADTTRKPIYLENELLARGKKYEDFAQSPDGKWIFLTTAFDRIKDNSNEWDGYNMLLCWKPGQEGQPKVLAPQATDKTSVAYRKNFSQALGGMPYFKIEGLAATNTDLIWGVREEGQKFDNFTPKVKFLRTPYSVQKDSNGEHVVLKDEFTVIRDFDLTKAYAANQLPQPLAVSSIEYDPNRHIFWVLTSYEKVGALGAYLWIISEKDLLNGGELTLIRTADGKPLTFSHKAEDLTFLDANTMLVIHDDDREKTTINNNVRKPNQAAYSLVNLR